MSNKKLFRIKLEHETFIVAETEAEAINFFFENIETDGTTLNNFIDNIMGVDEIEETEQLKGD